MRFSDAEWIVMEALWRGAGPSRRERSSARDVIDRLGKRPGWAYTTVKTMLTRLVEKGAVTEERKGNVATYRPKVSRLAARKSAVKSLVERAFGGAYGAFVHHLVEGGPLSDPERARLRKLLGEDADDAVGAQDVADDAPGTGGKSK
jgi:predicted transcriptional regulator